MKFYISGKISGTEKVARRQFEEAKTILVACGHKAVNPFDNGLTEDDTWERHLAVDILELMRCDALVQLPTWEDSRGARLEHEIARECNMPIYSISDFINNNFF